MYSFTDTALVPKMTEGSDTPNGFYFEWRTKLPDNSVSSPVFTLDKFKWSFRICRDPGSGYIIKLVRFLDGKADLPPFRVETYSGYNNLTFLVIYAFGVSPHSGKCDETSRLDDDSGFKCLGERGDEVKCVVHFGYDVLPEPRCFLTDTKVVLTAPLVQSAPQASDNPCLKALLEDFGQLLDESNLEEPNRGVSNGDEPNRSVSNVNEPNRNAPNEGETSHDVVLKCGDLTINAHRAVLASRSKFFKTMLQSGMVEGRTGQVDVQDMDGDVFRDFVRYLYTGAVPELIEDRARKLYEAADRYDVASLMRRCASSLTRKLTSENACDILETADAHSDAELKERIIDYILKEKIPLRDEIWKPFSERCPALAVVVANRFIKLQNST